MAVGEGEDSCVSWYWGMAGLAGMCVGGCAAVHRARVVVSGWALERVCVC